MPERCDLVAAAALPVAFGTSHVALIHRARLISAQVSTIIHAMHCPTTYLFTLKMIHRYCWFWVLLEGLVFLPSKLPRFVAPLLLPLLGTCFCIRFQCFLNLAFSYHVSTVNRGAEKIALLKSLGVDHVVDSSSKESMSASVKDFLKARKLKGVDVLYDPVGGKLTKEALRLLNWGAQILVIGFASGEVPLIPANIALVKVTLPFFIILPLFSCFLFSTMKISHL